MKNLVPGGAANAQWRAWLDRVAAVCNSLAPTPVLFRPFHEMYLKNWWGAPYVVPQTLHPPTPPTRQRVCQHASVPVCARAWVYACACS